MNCYVLNYTNFVLYGTTIFLNITSKISLNLASTLNRYTVINAVRIVAGIYCLDSLIPNLINANTNTNAIMLPLHG